MKNRTMLWLLAVTLAAAPAQLLRAQEGPEGAESEEVEVWSGGPKQPPPGMEIEKRGPQGKRAVKADRGEDEPGESRMTVKVRKMMGGPGMGMGMALLSEEDTLALIKKHDAVFGKKVEDLKDVAPAKYHMVMQMAERMLSGAKMEEDEAVEKDAVRTLALEFDVKELTRKLEKAADADKGAITDSLKTKVSELFDLKSRAQEQRVKHMETELAKLKKNLENRKLNKAKIVEQRVGQLTGEGLGW
ncbi:MAG: hypothetical protein NTY45_10005 [Elusimicrobia bacterium]|nr:hypothetical protein [Elusimicrobiota bacterium]